MLTSTIVDLSNRRQSFNTKVTDMRKNLPLLIPLGVEAAAMTSSKQREFLFSGILSIFIIECLSLLCFPHFQLQLFLVVLVLCTLALYDLSPLKPSLPSLIPIIIFFKIRYSFSNPLKNYLFGCTGFQLWHVGSFICSIWDLIP